MGSSNKEKKGVEALEIAVPLHCQKCGQDVKKALLKVKGVKKVTIDFKKGTARIEGRDIKEKLKKKLKKHAEVIPPPKPPQEKVAPPSNHNVTSPYWPEVVVFNGHYYYREFPHGPLVACGPPAWAHHYPYNYENNPNECSIL